MNAVSRQGSEDVVSFPNDPLSTPELAATMGVTSDEWNRIQEFLARPPTFTELGVFSVMWSEHCSYKSSRVHLKRLPTTGPQVVQGPGENAGAVDIGDGFCAVFKMESHNHPSFIEPYQGAATGVGGILRDVFTMGARPVASLNSLRFGRPDHPKTPRLLRGVVAGIGGYGNCVGVPTVGGELMFDASYDGNILVNAFTMGIARSDQLFFGRATGVGNPVIYVGAPTGRDGIHGATMASAEFDEHSHKKLPTVQVGDPFKEKLLLEACLEIFRRGCLEGIQDMGAAGLTSSSVEMAARGGTGLCLDLDAIPRRAKNLTPYELLLSESQERMLMVAKKGREYEVFEVCEKWGLSAAVVGEVTDTGRFVCLATPGYDPLGSDTSERSPKLVVSIPVTALTDGAPCYDRPQLAPKERPADHEPLTVTDPSETLLRLLSSPNIGSRQWVWRQYDHIVRDGTVLGPGKSDAAVIRVFCETDAGMLHKFVAMSVDGNGRHVQLDPYNGGAMVVAECARNVVCSGALPLGLTDCLNFGNPENPETMWRFARAVDGIRDACVALGVAVVSGNVSLYNETDGKPILPTPTVGIVGKLESPVSRLSIAFRTAGHLIAHLGVPARGMLGGSELWMQARGSVGGPYVQLDLDAEARLQKAVLSLANRRSLSSAHDVSDGGLCVSLAESCIAGNLGCRIEMTDLIKGLSQEAAAACLFSEEPSRVLVAFAPDQREIVEQTCREFSVPCQVLGMVFGENLEITGYLNAKVSALASAHASALDAIVGPAA